MPPPPGKQADPAGEQTNFAPTALLPHQKIQIRLQEAVAQALPDAQLEQVLVRPCPDPRFGDYQSAALMSLAKSRKINPRRLAAEVAARLQVSEWCEKVETAGPGFLNFQLKPSAVAEALESAARGEHLFFSKTASPKQVVIDFSSPNVAKPMHVGHIRSTILGDSLARIFRALGHGVISDNHVGDWGTQFGKLIVGWKTAIDRAALEKDPASELERLYQEIHHASERDPALLEAARQELVKLQNGDPENLAIWRQMIAFSEKQFQAIYARLDVQFDHMLGESFYNPKLKPLVEELVRSGVARESEGALVVFFDQIPELKAHPAIVQKSDGAANYTTTDLATLQHRVETWNPDEIIYVTDGRQQLHFKQLFAIFRQWKPESKVELAHVWFGAILGEDGKPFKTRTGETIRLAGLLDEAEERAYQVVSEKNPQLEESLRREIARKVGIGAIKYADLLPNRQSDYVFSWDKMLALQGNTAPYLQYAHARIFSILRKLQPGISLEEAARQAAQSTFNLSAPAEIALARHMLNFGLVMEQAAQECRPNFLCNYLFELAGYFAQFYENCPVLRAAETEKPIRIALCSLTGKLLAKGLNLLGIEAPQQM
jgi:arginyl-tRNA synthetase